MAWRTGLERLIGASFIVAGTAKFFGLGEDGTGTLAAMAHANQGTELDAVSDLIAANPAPVLWLVGAAMVSSGLAQALQVSWRLLAGVGQLAMIVFFITRLNRAYPAVFLDGLYVIALAPILLAKNESATA